MTVRLGLCCLFRREPVRFRTVTAKTLGNMKREAALARVSAICLENAKNLLLAVQTVRTLGIGSFRISSDLFPRATHPEVGYALDDLPDGGDIRKILGKVKNFRRRHSLRLSFHPDQFVVLSSPKKVVVEKSLVELEHHGRMAVLTGADLINIHGGGVYGNRNDALRRFADHKRGLSNAVRKRLAVENDDRSYTVADLLPFCSRTNIPLVYDIHHHRCLPDGMGEEEATGAAVETWGTREPCFHIASPKHGWDDSSDPKPHADYIDIGDFPQFWVNLEATVDVEAKAKELAVLQLMKDLLSIWRPASSGRSKRTGSVTREERP